MIFGNPFTVPKDRPLLGCYFYCGCSGCLGNEFADAIGELGSLCGPIVDAVTLELDACWVGAGIVGSYHFDGTAVAGAIFLNNDNAVVGLLTRANARQTDHQHWECLSKQFVWALLRCVASACHVAGQAKLYVTQHLSMAEMTLFRNGFAS